MTRITDQLAKSCVYSLESTDKKIPGLLKARKSPSLFV